MKVLLDACVLYPTVMREILIGAAEVRLYEPLWSARILEEWARAAARLGPEQAAVARAEVALLTDRWPNAAAKPRDGDLARLVLPDMDDVHVLASAISGSASILITLNRKDFPRHTLNEEGVSRQDPDGFLRALWGEAPDLLADVAARVRAKAEAISGQPQPLRALLKKARLPKLAKALG